jgi:hypothetical protein
MKGEDHRHHMCIQGVRCSGEGGNGRALALKGSLRLTRAGPHPVRHVHRPLVCDKLQDATVGVPAVAPVLNLEEHGVVDLELSCNNTRRGAAREWK